MCYNRVLTSLASGLMHLSFTVTHDFILFVFVPALITVFAQFSYFSFPRFFFSTFSNFFVLFFFLVFYLPGEAACKHIFKIPLCNLVGRSIERPLKSPLVNKVLTAPAPVTVAPTPLISATHSLSLSRMEIKEIASRTRKELLGRVEEKCFLNFLSLNFALFLCFSH